MVSYLIFRSLNHFDFIFVYGMRNLSSLILLPYSYPFFPTTFIKETVFPIVYFWLLCHRLAVVTFQGFLFHFIDLLPVLVNIPYHLLTVALTHSLKSGMLVSPILFFLKNSLAIQSLLFFYTNFRIICWSMKNAILFWQKFNWFCRLLLQDHMIILIISILPIHEYDISFLCVCMCVLFDFLY